MAKCPICYKNQPNKESLINHMESTHMNELPDDMSTAQFIYYKTHGRPYGLCRICGKPTPWNEKAGKPSQNCGSQRCKDKVREIAQQRMLKTYGKTSLMNDIKHQEKMLSHRKISGVYVWSDGKHKFTYTGKYEKFAIEWLDKVMDLNPEKIQMPGPIIPYEFNGEIKYWITDIYLEDFNLIIEIKAGKDENTHPGFEHNRELEAAKDAAMLKQKEYNYTKITHKSMLNLVKILSMIRMRNIDSGNNSNNDPIITINESTLINQLYPEVTDIINYLVNKYNVSYTYDQLGYDEIRNRNANGLKLYNELYIIKFKDFDEINELFNKYKFTCISKNDTCIRYTLNNSKCNIECAANLLNKTLTFKICYDASINECHINNSDIGAICEAIINETPMSIANISPIVTNNAPFVDIENKELLEKLKSIKQEAIDTQEGGVFSPRDTFGEYDPFVPSNNFIEKNEEVIADIETDAYNTRPNDFAQIGIDNIKSYFN